LPTRSDRKSLFAAAGRRAAAARIRNRPARIRAAEGFFDVAMILFCRKEVCAKGRGILI
jgi:hypothetical protein